GRVLLLDFVLDTALKEAIQKCRSLPSLPVVAAQLIEVINQDDFGLNDVADVVKNDLAISTKLIATANSSAFLRGSACTTVEQATNRLGVDATVVTALSFSLSGPMRGTGVKGINTERLWKRSIASASIARLLAIHLGSQSADRCFLAALIQDLGIMVLSRTHPSLYESFLNGSHYDAILAEYAALECDHAEVGAWLLEQWHFPSVISALVARSHEVPEAMQSIADEPEAWCVAVSGVLADALVDEEKHDIARILSSLHQVCSEADDAREQMLETDIANALADAESLFETKLITEPFTLMEASKELLFEQSASFLAPSHNQQIERLEARVASLEKDSRVDALTGTFNRAHFERELDRCFSVASSERRALSLMFIDADHFKSINDTYGHLAGDEVLKWMAGSLKETVRTSDVVARYGGEEFVVILPGLEECDAAALAERIRVAMGSGVVEVSNATIRFTVSIGIACFEPNGRINTKRQLILAADQAMYVAKDSGRDMCVSASEMQSSLKSA
ncbi:MAG: GGDEF domain-containing protein, partial [Pseudomonadota bacterium]